MKIKLVTTKAEIENRRMTDRKRPENGAKAIWLTIKMRGDTPIPVAGRSIAEVKRKLKAA